MARVYSRMKMGTSHRRLGRGKKLEPINGDVDNEHERYLACHQKSPVVVDGRLQAGLDVARHRSKMSNVTNSGRSTNATRTSIDDFPATTCEWKFIHQ
jgi:hypothetical protein